MAGIENGDQGSPLRLQDKAGRDRTSWFQEIATALAALPGGPHVIDGEAAVLREDGTSDFNLLQTRARKRKPYPGAPRVTYCAFDVLVLNGVGVMSKTLIERKTLLERLLAAAPQQGILYVKDLPADAALFQSMTLPPPEGSASRSKVSSQSDVSVRTYRARALMTGARSRGRDGAKEGSGRSSCTGNGNWTPYSPASLEAASRFPSLRNAAMASSCLARGRVWPCSHL